MLAARPHVAPSPPPLGLTKKAASERSERSSARAVPLCQDTKRTENVLHSVSGTKFSLPGANLSAAYGFGK